MIGPRNGVSGYLPVQASGMRVTSPRDLAFVIDSNGYRWARLMHNLLREICYAVNQSETGALSEAECRRYRKKYRTILTQGGKESVVESQNRLDTTCMIVC